MKIKIGGKVLLAFLISIFFIGGLCQNLNSAPEEAKRISMDFQEAALKNVLKVFSQQAELNFVATENIEDKRITLYLDNVTVQDALDSIIKANNLTYEQAPGSAVFIVKESGKPLIDMITKVYSLNYARVAGNEGGAKEGEIKSIIENLLTKDSRGNILGSIVIDARTNSIIITSIYEDFPLIERTLGCLDLPEPQALIEAEIVEVNTKALKQLGLEWGSATEGTFFSFTGPSRVSHFPFIREKQPFSRGLLGGPLASTSGTTLTAGTNTLGSLSLTEFRIVLKALEKESEARYLSKPRIMVVNNVTAEIKVSADTAIGIRQEESKEGMTTQEAERVETGIILKVTPTINKQGFITMTLEPEVSRAVISDIQMPTGGYFYDPAKRAVKTTVMVKDGQTIAVGGLLMSSDEAAERAVPGLSKIPLLGNLFKSKKFYDEDVTELVIFVTCTIVKDDYRQVARAEGLIKEYKEEEIVELAPAGIPEEKYTKQQRDKAIARTVIRLKKKRELEKKEK